MNNFLIKILHSFYFHDNPLTKIIIKLYTNSLSNIYKDLFYLSRNFLFLFVRCSEELKKFD